MIVTQVWNGKKAVELVSKKDFDGILMNLQMPVMDGYSASEQIRVMENTKFQELPIIALTANVMADDRAKSEAAGMIILENRSKRR